MLLGKLSGSAPKSAPVVNDPTNLDEVVVTARPVPVSEYIPEIVVSARPIPWYVWAIAGGATYIALSKLLGGR